MICNWVIMIHEHKIQLASWTLWADEFIGLFSVHMAATGALFLAAVTIHCLHFKLGFKGLGRAVFMVALVPYVVVKPENIVVRGGRIKPPPPPFPLRASATSNSPSFSSCSGQSMRSSRPQTYSRLPQFSRHNSS